MKRFTSLVIAFLIIISIQNDVFFKAIKINNIKRVCFDI